MNKQEQIQAFDAFAESMRNTLLSKGDDYAGQEDRLSNFKAVGSALGLDPRMVCLIMIQTKVVRLANLLNNNDAAKNEPMDDSMLDLANYAALMKMVHSDIRAITLEQEEIDWNNFLIDCPADCATNVEWKAFIDWLNAKFPSLTAYTGNIVGTLYGAHNGLKNNLSHLSAGSTPVITLKQWADVHLPR